MLVGIAEGYAYVMASRYFDGKHEQRLIFASFRHHRRTPLDRAKNEYLIEAKCAESASQYVARQPGNVALATTFVGACIYDVSPRLSPTHSRRSCPNL